MALSADPTVAEIQAAIISNSLYHINNSLTEAKDYIEAVSAALTYPQRAAKGAEEIQYDTRTLERMLDRAMVWYNVYSQSSHKYFDTSRVR